MMVVALVSGGKDSCYAMMRCIDYGHQIVALANLLPADDSVDELDSYMYQTVGHQIVVSYAECMGLPLFRRRIRGSSRHQELNYKVTPGDEVEDMFILLNEVKQKIPSVTAVSSGAIASDYQRLRVESVCSRLGLVSLAYLWKQDQTLLLEEMIKKGIVAITIKVATMGLVPAKHLGKELVDLQPHLLQMKELYGINVCGEGGEYETLSLDCPLFTNARIILDRFQVVLHSPDSFAPVGILHPLAFHLEDKRDAPAMSINSGNSDMGLKQMSSVHEVLGNFVDNYMVKCQSGNMTPDFHTTKKMNVCISSTRRDIFSIGCWIQNSSGTSEDFRDDLSSVLGRIELQLSYDGFDWGNVLYIHLYISNMKNFTLANEVYVRYITENKCSSGVPSRSTVELPLVQAGLGNAYVEVLVANDMIKRVLHVQSISSWAPSCIGPYSQATLHREILYMAGQLGLDPPSMTLRSGGSVAELEQALENCEAVANCFKSSILSSAVLFVIYCSASLASCERTKIQQRMETFLGPQLYELRNVGCSGIYDPIFLYVLASDLPKGALIEVKPVLHIPQDGSTQVETSELQPACRKESRDWGFKYSEWHDPCCQKYVVHGNICVALISITNDVAEEIFQMTGQSSPNFKCDCSEQQTKSIAMSCTYLLDKILLENNFSWKDVTNLRIYYRTNIFVLPALYLAFSEIFGEFVKLGKGTGVGEENIFNLIPVSGSGRSASMDDLITCELFATKI